MTSRHSSRQGRRIYQVVLIYAVFASAWILFSDLAVRALFANPEARTLASVAKGWLFVAVTSFLLYGLMRWLLARPGAAPDPRRLARPGLVGWPVWALYLFAVVAATATLLVRAEIAEAFDDRPLLIVLMFPIILSAALGGIGPGLVATLIVALGVAYLAIPPLSSFAIQPVHDLIQWGFLLANGVLVSILAELSRHSWRQTADALAEQVRANTLLGAIAEGSDDAIFAKDADGRYLVCNRAAARYIGKPAEAVLGHDDHALFPPEQARMLTDIGRRVMATKRTETNQELLDTAAGPRLFLATKGPLRAADGTVFGTFGISRDITEQTRAEQGLRDSEGRFRALVEQTLAGIYIIQDDRFRYVNPGFAAIFGYADPADLVDRVPVADLVSEEYRDRVAGNIRRRIEGEVSDIQYTFTGLRRDGRRVDVEVHGRVFDYRGRPAVIGLILDVTNRTQAERALRESEGRFRDIVGATADWVWEVDAEARFTYASDSVRDLLGYEPAELLGRTPFDLMPPEEAERVRAEYAAIVARRAPFRDLDNINRRKDGGLCHVQTNGTPILDEAGALIGYRGLDRDVTEMKRALDELQRLADDMGATLQAIPDLLFEIDEAGRYLGLRASQEALLAAPAEHLLGRTVAEVLPAEAAAAIMAAVESAGRVGADYGRVIRLPLADGARYFELSVARKERPAGPFRHFIVLSRDITPRKTAEVELIRRNEELERFNRATVGRELDMIELKRRVNALSIRLGEAPPYDLSCFRSDEPGRDDVPARAATDAFPAPEREPAP